MTDEHKKNMAEGRRHRRTVDSYLKALEQFPKIEQQRKNAAANKDRIAQLSEEIDQASGVDKLILVQQRENLTRDSAVGTADFNIEELEAEFVEVAAAYGEKLGISYTSWRDLGVPKDVLQRAGVKRTRRPNKEK